MFRAESLEASAVEHSIQSLKRVSRRGAYRQTVADVVLFLHTHSRTRESGFEQNMQTADYCCTELPQTLQRQSLTFFDLDGCRWQLRGGRLQRGRPRLYFDARGRLRDAGLRVCDGRKHHFDAVRLRRGKKLFLHITQLLH